MASRLMNNNQYKKQQAEEHNEMYLAEKKRREDLANSRREADKDVGDLGESAQPAAKLRRRRGSRSVRSSIALSTMMALAQAGIVIK